MKKPNILLLGRQREPRKSLARRLHGLGYGVREHNGGSPPGEDSGNRVDLIVIDDRAHLEEIGRWFPQAPPPVLLATTSTAAALDGHDDAPALHGLLDAAAEECLLAGQIDLAVRRARAETRLQRSERAFRTLATCVPEAVLRADSAGRIIYMNPHVAGLFGMPQQSLIGKTPLEAGLPPDFSHAWQGIVAAVADSASPSRVTVEPRAGTRFYEINAAPETAADGSIAAILATVRDTSEVHGLLERHSLLSRRLLHHLQRTPLAVMEWSADGSVLAWNNRAVEVFEWQGDEIVPGGDWFLQIVHPSDRQAFGDTLRRLATGLDDAVFTSCRGLRRDGTTIHCEWHLSACPDPRGDLASILCLVHDTTGREKAEQAMRRSREDLESRLLEKSTILSKCREELEFLKSACAGLENDLVRVIEREQRRIGHDLHDGVCQELAGIRLSLEALLDGGGRLCGKTRRTLRHTLDAVERASRHTRLVSRGLAPACLEQGDIADALREFSSNLQTLFGISCNLSINGDIPFLDGHRATHLFRISQEAVQNAVRHGRADEISILLDFDSAPGRLVVEDNGHGLTDAAASSDGMGMRIMRQRARLIDSEVVVQSGGGGGVRVTCEFPA